MTGYAAQFSDIGREVGKGVADVVGERVARTSGNFITEFFSAFGLSNPVAAYGVLFGLVGGLAALFYAGFRQRRREEREAPAVEEPAPSGTPRLEWFLLDAHQQYVRGEITQEQFQVLVKAHADLAKTVASVRKPAAGAPKAPPKPAAGVPRKQPRSRAR
ncbi:MAG: hypothetical protein QXQ87_08420 [Halobacteria archaeon]